MNPGLLAFSVLDARIATQCRLLSLRQFECMVHIGVHDFEKQSAQRMWFDIDLCVRLADAPAAQDDISQTLNYLKASGCCVGLIINFGKKSLEYKRLIL